MAATPERRQHPRYEPDDLECTLEGIGRCPVLKISLAGLLVLSRTELELGREIDLSLHIEPPLRCTGRVVFVGPDLADEEPRYRIRLGIGFDELDPRHRDALERYIDADLT